MKFLAALFASAATLSAANPLPPPGTTDAADALAPRADIVPVTCPQVAGRGNGEVHYSVGNIQEAFNIASGLLRPPPDNVVDNRGNEYPKYFSNFEQIPLPADCTGPAIIDQREFPILRGKVPMGDGSRAGPDRIIFARRSDGNFIYCYTLYHQDGTEFGAGPFAQCT